MTAGPKQHFRLPVQKGGHGVFYTQRCTANGRKYFNL